MADKQIIESKCKKIYYKSDFKIVERLTKDELKDIPFRYTYFTNSFYTASWDGTEYKNCKKNPDGSITVLFRACNLGIGPLKVKREYFIPDNDFEDGICNKVYVEDTDVVLVSGTSYPVIVEMEVIPPYIYIQEIVDNTDDTSPTKALSANQGRVLKERIDTVSEAVNIGLGDEAIQRMVADTALGNRLTALDTDLRPQVEAAVKTTGAQAISGVKTFNDNLSIANKTTIAKNIDGGELKVLHHGSSKGFIVRTRNTSDTLLPLEMLTTNGYQSYTYVFPAKGGTMALIEDVSAAVAGAIAQVVANAPDDLNNLKEVADYIASDKTRAAEIEVSISRLQGKCSSLESTISYYDANFPYLVQNIALALEESAHNRVMIDENILPRLAAGLLSENDKQTLSRTVYMGTFSRSGDAEAKAAEYANDRSKVFLLYDLEDGGSGVVEQAFSNTAATIQFLYLKGSRYVREVKWATNEIGSWKNVTGSERISGLSFNPSTGVLSLKDALGARDWGSVTLSLSGVPENLTTVYTTPVPFYALSKTGRYLIHLDNLYTRTDFETTGNSTTSLTDAYQNKRNLSDGIYEYLKNKNLSNNSNLKAEISVNAFGSFLTAEIFVWAPYEYRLYAKLACWLAGSGEYKVINETDFKNEQDSNT